jgi:predicted DsbA family dithiol-disulfide isomerase
MTERVTIDVFSDVVCPWCLIGKRRLDQALQQLDGEVEAEIRWLPFELNPDMPKEGTDRATYLEAKFGGPERAKEVYGRVEAAAQAEGLDVKFDKISRQPNTFDAHRLVAWAQTEGKDEAMVDGLFDAYFRAGRDLTDPETLVAVAGEVGLDAATARGLLAGQAGAAEVRALENVAQQLGVEGVPFFIFDGRLAVAGAEAPDYLAGAIRRAITARTEEPDPA